jgi:hypothetical protein
MQKNKGDLIFFSVFIVTYFCFSSVYRCHASRGNEKIDRFAVTIQSSSRQSEIKYGS